MQETRRLNHQKCVPEPRAQPVPARSTRIVTSRVSRPLHHCPLHAERNQWAIHQHSQMVRPVDGLLGLLVDHPCGASQQWTEPDGSIKDAKAQSSQQVDLLRHPRRSV